MSFRQKLLLWGLLSSIGCGLSYLSIQHYLQQQSALWEQQHAEPTANFLVLKKGLSAQQPLSAELLAVRSFPARFAQASWLTESDVDKILNTRLKVAVEAGEPLKHHYFQVESERSALRRSLEAGEKAVTTRISMEQSLAGMMQPGDFIDIVVMPPGVMPLAERGALNPVAVERLSGIQVLALDQNLLASSAPLPNPHDSHYGNDFEHYAETITLRLTDAQALRFERMRTQSFSVWLHGTDPSPALPQDMQPAAPRIHHLGEY